ncbi:TrbG/VirB9 family P-type conjugative transfer protein [Escherichia coli]|uniref:TrbG/VirB9 family P-type conjugative transfer protein n=1 Tax=Escherichia coli TaxID=562 RepID=UPI002022D852|nr:TrbG/VirB9 family P-type conjugative transfer protein [Escherichia coli]
MRVKAGAQTTIKFGQDETIKDVGIGDPEAWSVSVRTHSVSASKSRRTGYKRYRSDQ